MAIQYTTYATPRVDLGVALQEYNLGKVRYIGDQVFPIINVPKKDGTFSLITRESALRARSLRRSPGASYAEDTFEAEDKAYSCEEYGLVQPVDDTQRELYAGDFDAEMVAADIARNALMRDYELRVSTLAFDATTSNSNSMYTDYSSSAPWTTSTSDVMAQMNVARAAIRAKTGMDPDTLIMSQTNLERLSNNDDMIARIVYSQAAGFTTMAGQIGNILGFPKVYVSNAVYNSAIEGQSWSGTNIWSNLYALICVTPGSASPAEACLGRSFLWTGDSPSSLVVESYRDEDKRSTKIRVRHYMDELVYDWSYGYLLKVATS